MAQFYRHLLLMAAVLIAPVAAQSAEDDCGCSEVRVALKSNLLHDVVLTPDIGVEMRLPANFSVGAEGIMAWWTNDSRHHCWRIYGGWLEARYWLGNRPSLRALTGHHLGIYGSIHSFDFEFGKGHGWQTPQYMWSAGISYGYSMKLNSRLNLDISGRIGYTEGVVTSYDSQCGMHICTGREVRRYVGLTDLCVTLVWFPGKKNKNNPNLIED